MEIFCFSSTGCVWRKMGEVVRSCVAVGVRVCVQQKARSQGKKKRSFSCAGSFYNPSAFWDGEKKKKKAETSSTETFSPLQSRKLAVTLHPIGLSLRNSPIACRARPS